MQHVANILHTSQQKTTQLIININKQQQQPEQKSLKPKYKNLLKIKNPIRKKPNERNTQATIWERVSKLNNKNTFNLYLLVSFKHKRATKCCKNQMQKKYKTAKAVKTIEQHKHLQWNMLVLLLCSLVQF